MPHVYRPGDRIQMVRLCSITRYGPVIGSKGTVVEVGGEPGSIGSYVLVLFDDPCPAEGRHLRSLGLFPPGFHAAEIKDRCFGVYCRDVKYVGMRMNPNKLLD